MRPHARTPTPPARGDAQGRHGAALLASAAALLTLTAGALAQDTQANEREQPAKATPPPAQQDDRVGDARRGPDASRDGQAAEAGDAEMSRRERMRAARENMPPRFRVTLRQNASFEVPGGVDGGGDVFVARATQGVDFFVRPTLGTNLILSLTNDLDFYDFDDATDLDPADGDPFSSFNSQQARAVVFHALSRKWQFLGTGSIGFAREDDADFEDALLWTAGAGFQYRVNPRFTVGAGFLAQSRLEDDVRLFPFPVVDLEFDLADKLTLNLNTFQGVSLNYAPREDLTLILTGTYAEREFRLDDKGIAPGGLFEEKRGEVRIDAQWTPVENLKLTAGVGAVFGRDFEIKNQIDNRVSQADVDPGAVFRVGLSYDF